MFTKFREQLVTSRKTEANIYELKFVVSHIGLEKAFSVILVFWRCWLMKMCVSFLGTSFFMSRGAGHLIIRPIWGTMTSCAHSWAVFLRIWV